MENWMGKWNVVYRKCWYDDNWNRHNIEVKPLNEEPVDITTILTVIKDHPAFRDNFPNVGIFGIDGNMLEIDSPERLAKLECPLDLILVEPVKGEEDGIRVLFELFYAGDSINE